MEDAVLGRSAAAEPPFIARLGRVAGGVICSYRASLIERDIWEHVCTRFSRSGTSYSVDWLEQVSARDWVDVEAFVALLDAIAATMGLDELRWMVRRRIGDAAGSNYYAPILRSWARSFENSPEHMLRGLVHVFRAALRSAGSLRHATRGPGCVHLVVEGPLADAYRASAALGTELEGLALGLLDKAQPRPLLVEVELCRGRDPVTLVCTYGGS